VDAVGDGTTPAFLTGSRVYGRPHDGSDVDLVVLVSEGDFERLRAAAEADDLEGRDTSYLARTSSASLRFGDLNVLCCRTREAYDVWREGTDRLVEMRRQDGPVDRDTATDLFQQLRRQARDRGGKGADRAEDR
jgi:hypothetical protein